MFALRHTLSFHERCGCPSINDWAAREGGPARHPGPANQPFPGFRPGMVPPGGPIPPGMPPMQGLIGVPPGTVHPHVQHRAYSGAPAAGSSASPPPVDQPAGFSNRVVPMQIQAQPPLQPPQPQPIMQAAPSQSVMPDVKPTFAPPSLNLSAASLRPQPPALTAAQQLGASIQRPGSAGARFGIATPNFADLFGGQMDKFPGISTPGGLTMSPMLPNTFGLAIQDIPARPASAPPTPSPALDIRVVVPVPGGDYFSAKNPAGSTPGNFGDLLASLNRPHVHPSMLLT